MALSGLALWGFLGVVMTAALIHSSIGFGFSIFAMMFFPYLFASYPQATAVSSVLSMLTSAIVAVRLRRRIQWKAMAPCAAGYLIASPIAIHFSTILPKETLTRALGAALVALGMYFIVFGKRVHIRPGKISGALIGLAAGTMGGFFAVGGPPLVVYFLSSLKDKEEYSATVQCLLALTGIYSNLFRVVKGIFTFALLESIAVGAIAMALGSLLGYAIMKKLPAHLLRRLVYCVTIFAGTRMLLGF